MKKRVTKRIKNKKAFGFVDSGVKILIAVVIGALMLGGTYTLAKDTVLPSVKSKVESLFDYNGNSQTAGTDTEDEKYPLNDCPDVLIYDDGCNISSFGNSVDSSMFREIYIDGILLDEDEYMLLEYPGTHVVISEDVAKGLSFDSHTVKIIFDDGYGTGTFNVVRMIEFSIEEDIVHDVRENWTFAEWFDSNKSDDVTNYTVWRKNGDSKIYTDASYSGYLQGVDWNTVIEKNRRYYIIKI